MKLSGGTNQKPLPITTVYDNHWTQGAVVDFSKSGESTISLQEVSQKSKQYGWSYGDGGAQTIIISPEFEIDTSNDPVETFLYSETWKLQIPVPSIFVGTLNFTVTFPDPFRIVGEHLLTYAINDDNNKAFRYLALISAGLVRERIQVRPTLSVRCHSEDKNAWFDRTCEILFFSGIPGVLEESVEGDYEIVE